MAALSGTAGSVVYTTGGTTVVGEIKEWSIDSSMEPPETTAFGDQWKEFIAGIRDWSASFNGNFDSGDAVQTSLRNAFLGGSAITGRFYVSSANYFSGSGFVTGHSPTTSYDGVAAIEYAMQGNGALTYT